LTCLYRISIAVAGNASGQCKSRVWMQRIRVSQWVWGWKSPSEVQEHRTRCMALETERGLNTFMPPQHRLQRGHYALCFHVVCPDVCLGVLPDVCPARLARTLSRTGHRPDTLPATMAVGKHAVRRASASISSPRYMQELLKSDSVCKSYAQIKKGSSFLTHSVDKVVHLYSLSS